MKPLRLLSFSDCPTVAPLKSLFAENGIVEYTEIDLEGLAPNDPLRSYSSPTVLYGDELILGGRTSGGSMGCSVLPSSEMAGALRNLKTRMNRDYWLGRWERGETGWHQTGTEPALVHWFGHRSRKRIFVPLCGKSLDLKWLLDQGHDVIGCELSTEAVNAFFNENGIEFESSKEGKFAVYRAHSITIYNGDVFDLEASHLGRLDAVYDRAALIALGPELRARYSRHLLKILAPSREHAEFEFLQVVLERSPPDRSGPPFSIPAAEVTQAYGEAFRIEPTSREAVEARGPAESRTEECVYLLQPKT